MTSREKGLLGISDEAEARSLRDAVYAMVAREEQRAADKSDDDALRARLRASDEARWAASDARLDRVQGELVTMRGDLSSLPTTIETKLTAAKLATELLLKDATVLAAQLSRERDARRAVTGFFGKYTRIALGVVVAIAIALVAYLFFHDGETDVGEVLTFLAVCTPFVIFVLAGGRQPKPPATP